MGETYRGLTIRLDADVTGLQKALQSSSSAIASAQKELRLLQKAAKLDPDDMVALGIRTEQTSDKARALAERLSFMREELRQLKASGVEKIADATKNAALEAERARERYARVDDQIKRLKNSIAQAAGYDLSKTDPFKGLDSADQVVSKMKELKATTKQIDGYLEMVKEHFQALNALGVAKTVVQVKDLKANLAAADVEARSLYQEMARLSSRNPSVTLTDGFREFKTAMEMADAAAGELRAELKSLDKSLKLDPSNIDVARLKMASMQEQVRLNVSQMTMLKKQLEALRSNGIDKVAGGVTNLHAETAKAEKKVADLSMELDEARAKVVLLDKQGLDKAGCAFVEARRDVERLEEALGSAKAELDKLGSAKVYNNLNAQMANLSASTNRLLDDMGRAESKTVALRGSMQQLGWAMYSTTTPMMTMFAHAAVQAADDVDKSYRDMRKTVQGTEEQFEGLRSAALDYSRTHFTSADQILEIEAMGGQLGVASEKLESFATTVSSLEIATNLDADTAAEQLGQLEGILDDMTQDDFPRFGDALVRLGNNNATLEDKITDVMLRISSMGTITGFTTPQLLAWSTAIAATGQGAEASGTAISKTMSDIESAVGAGGDALQGFADVAGMSASEFAHTWNTDPSGAMYAFIQGLKDIESNGGSADSTLKALKITSVRQKQALLGLTQTIDGLNANLQMSEDAWNGVGDEWGEAGDAAREADAKTQGFSGTLQMLKNNFQTLGVEVGDSLTPVLSGLNGIVTVATKAFSGLSNEGKLVVDAVVLLAAAFGPATVGINAVYNAGKNLYGLFTSSKSAWGETVKSCVVMNSELRDQVVALGGAEKAYDKLERKQKLVAISSVALKGALIGVGFAAVAGTVGYLVQQLQSAHEKSENLKKATDGLVTATAALDESYKTMADDFAASDFGESAKRSFEELRQSVDDTIVKQAEMSDKMKASWEEINGNSYLLYSYVGVIEDLTDGYNENGVAAQLTAAEQEKLKAAVSGYNKICGTSYAVTDALNGELNVSSETIRKNADQWIGLAKAQALQEQATELFKEQFTLQKNLEDAQQKYNEAYAEYTEMIKAGVSGEGLKKFEDDLASANATLAEAEGLYNKNVEAVNDLQSQYEGLQGELADTSGATDQNTEAIRKANEEINKLIGELTEYRDENPVFAQMFADSGYSIETLAQKMSDAGISTDQLKSGIENASSAACDAFGRIESASDITLDEMLGNLQYNAEVTRTWSDNLVYLYENAGSESERSFIKYIQSLGVQYAPIVQQLVNDSSGKLAELAAAYEASGAAGAAAFLAEIGILPSSAAETTQETTDAITGTIQEGTPDAVGAMSDLAGGVDEAASEGAAKASADFAEGIGSAENEAAASANSMALQALTMNMYQASAYGWGSHLGRNFASGIASQERVVRNAALGLASAVKRVLGHTVAEEGPLHNGGKGESEWGSHAVLNFVNGMKSSESSLKREAMNLSAIAADSLREGRGFSMQVDFASRLACSGDSLGAHASTTSVVNNYYSIDGMTYQEGTPEGDAVKAVFDVVRKSASANPTRSR